MSWPQALAAWGREKESPLLSFKGTRTRLQVKCMACGQAKILCLLSVEGSLGDDIRCGPETSEREGHSKGLRKRSHRLFDSAGLSWMLQMFVHSLHRICFSLTTVIFDLTVFGGVPGSRDQCLPITFRSELRSQEGAFLLMIMPSLGIISTLDLDLQSWIWDNLLLLNWTLPTGGKPSAFPDPRQQGWEVECFAHLRSPSGIRTLEKENYSYKCLRL